MIKFNFIIIRDDNGKIISIRHELAEWDDPVC